MTPARHEHSVAAVAGEVVEGRPPRGGPGGGDWRQLLWLMGTHHGAASHEHLQAYLNEFAFRFNRRGNPQAAFQTILGIAGGKRGPELAQLYERPAAPPVYVQRELFA